MSLPPNARGGRTVRSQLNSTAPVVGHNDSTSSLNQTPVPQRRAATPNSLRGAITPIARSSSASGYQHAGGARRGLSASSTSVSTAFNPSDFAPPASRSSASLSHAGTTRQPPASSIVLTIADVEKLRAANSRRNQRAGGGAAQSEGSEEIDRKVLNLHSAVFSRLEASRLFAGATASGNKSGGANSSLLPTADPPAASSSSSLGIGAPLLKVSGVAEAIEVARLVAAEGRAGRDLGLAAATFGASPLSSRAHSSVGSLARTAKGSSISGPSRAAGEGDAHAPKAEGRRVSHSDDAEEEVGDASHSAEATGEVPPPSEQSPPQQQLSYYDRVKAAAPPAKQLRDTLAAVIGHSADDYRSGSALLDGCRSELDRFLSLEAASVSDTTPVSAEVRLATLFPQQAAQWRDVVEQTEKNSKGSHHVSGVVALAPSSISKDGKPSDEEASTAFTPAALKRIQQSTEERIGGAAVERYRTRRDVDPTFRNVSAHRLLHLRRDVFKLDEAEVATLADTSTLLRSKAEVQRLLQGMGAGGRQAAMDSMREWTEGIVRSGAADRAFEEALTALRPSPDGCVTVAQLRQCLVSADNATKANTSNTTATGSSGKGHASPSSASAVSDAIDRFVARVDPSGSGRAPLTAIRDAWADGGLGVLATITEAEARAGLDLVLPAARQSMGLHLSAAHVIQWLGRLGAALDADDAETFVAAHHPLTCERALGPDVFPEVQQLWRKAQQKASESVSEAGLHQRLRELETGQTLLDMALDDVSRQTSSMQSGFGAMGALGLEMDRQAKKIRLLAQLVPTRHTRNTASNTDISYPLDALMEGGDGDGDDEDHMAMMGGGGAGRMPAWAQRRGSTASSTTAPGADTPRGISPIRAAASPASGAGTPAAPSLSAPRSPHRGGGGDMTSVGTALTSAAAAKDRIISDLQQQARERNDELVRARVLHEGYRLKAEAAVRSGALMLQVKEAEIAQMAERLQGYEAIDSGNEGVLGEGAGAGAEERLQEIQSHFLKKMREAEAGHQEEVRAFARELQTLRNTSEEQRRTLEAEVNAQKDIAQRRLETIAQMEGEVAAREEALGANENTASNLAMSLKLLHMEMDELRATSVAHRDRAKMLEEQLAAARNTQKLYVPREEMERRVREKEAEFRLKMGTELDSREKMQEALKVAKDKLQAAATSEAEVKAAAERRLNAFRIDLEKISAHRLQLLGLLRDAMVTWFGSVQQTRRGLSDDVEIASDLFPWLSLQCNQQLQALTEAAQVVSKGVMEVAQGAEVHNALLELLREARKEGGRAFAPPRDNIGEERDSLEKQLATAVREAKESDAAAKEVTAMLAVTKCAATALEATLLTVTESLAAAAAGDDRSIAKFNLNGPGAEEIAPDRIGEALKAFVPRRMPATVANAIELSGGEDGLKNRPIAPPSDEGTDNKPKGKGGDKGMSFAARMARKNNSADPSKDRTATTQSSSKASKAGGGSSPDPAAPLNTSSASVAQPTAAASLFCYDPAMALQTYSQSLHASQMGVFGALGALSGRFTVLNTAMEESLAEAAASAAAAAEAKLALKKQINKHMLLDEEDELEALINERRTKRGARAPSLGSSGHNNNKGRPSISSAAAVALPLGAAETAVDEAHVASAAAPLLESLLWGCRSAASAAAATAVRPALAAAEQSASAANDAKSLEKLGAAKEAVQRARGAYVGPLLRYRVALRGASRTFKRLNKAFTDAMFGARRPSVAPTAASLASASSSASPPRVSSVEDLRGKVVAAKGRINSLLVDAAREVGPLVSAFQTALWAALAVAERVSAATASGGAKAAPTPLLKAAKGSQLLRATKGGAAASSRGVASGKGGKATAGPPLNPSGNSNRRRQSRSGDASAAKCDDDGLSSSAAAALRRAMEEDGDGAHSHRSDGASDNEDEGDEGRDKRDADERRQRSYDEAFKAFALDDEDNTFVSDGSSSATSHSSRSSSYAESEGGSHDSFVFPVPQEAEEGEGTNDHNKSTDASGSPTANQTVERPKPGSPQPNRRRGGPKQNEKATAAGSTAKASGGRVSPSPTTAAPASPGAAKRSLSEGKGVSGAGGGGTSRSRMGAAAPANTSVSTNGQSHGTLTSPSTSMALSRAVSRGGGGGGKPSGGAQSIRRAASKATAAGTTTGAARSAAPSSSSQAAAVASDSPTTSVATTPRLQPTLSTGKGKRRHSGASSGAGGSTANVPATAAAAAAGTGSPPSPSHGHGRRPSSKDRNAVQRTSSSNSHTSPTTTGTSSKRPAAAAEAYEARIKELTEANRALQQRLMLLTPQPNSGESAAHPSSAHAHPQQFPSLPLQHHDGSLHSTSTAGGRGGGGGAHFIVSTTSSGSAAVAPPSAAADLQFPSPLPISTSNAHTPRTPSPSTSPPRALSPTAQAAKAEQVRQRREEMERALQERKEAAAAEKAQRSSHLKHQKVASTVGLRAKAAAQSSSADPNLEGTASSAAAAEVDPTVEAMTPTAAAESDITARLAGQQRVSSAARQRPLPVRPMSGGGQRGGGGAGGVAAAMAVRQPLHRSDSDAAMAVGRPSSASTANANTADDEGVSGGYGYGHGWHPSAHPSVPQQLHYVPHYLRPPMESAATQTEEGPEAAEGASGINALAIGASHQPSALSVAGRTRPWAETEANFKAQAADDARRTGGVLYPHVSGASGIVASGVGASAAAAAAAAGSGYASSLRAVSATAGRPSVHMEPPTGKAFCGLRYKEVLVEAEAFEASSPQRAAALDILFSSLPAECRIVAAKYCLLAMFGGPQCPLVASAEAFSEHLTRYHFSPHSHIMGPRHGADAAVLRRMHSTLVAIGNALLTGDFAAYTRREGGVQGSSATLASSRAAGADASINVPLPTAVAALPSASENDASVVVTIPTASSPAATAVPWVNLDPRANAATDANSAASVSAGQSIAVVDADSSAALRGVSPIRRGFDEAVRAYVAAAPAPAAAYVSHRTISPNEGVTVVGNGVGSGEIAEGRRFLLAGRDNSVALRPHSSGGGPSANSTSNAAPTPYRVRPLPTPATFPSPSAAAALPPLAVGPSLSQSGAQPYALEVVPTGPATAPNGGRLPPPAERRPSSLPSAAQPRSAVAAILASLPRASTPSIPNRSTYSSGGGGNTSLVADPLSPFADKAIYEEMYASTPSAYKRGAVPVPTAEGDGKEGLSNNKAGKAHHPPDGSAIGVAAPIGPAEKARTAQLRAVASGRPNKGTIAMERALRAAVAENREAAKGTAAASPLTIARVLREGGKGDSGLATVSDALVPVVATPSTPLGIPKRAASTGIPPRK